MSAEEIITELPKLSPAELAQVEARLHELLREEGAECKPTWGESLKELAGTAQGLPDDFAQNHDHYLHCTPRR